MNSRSLTYTDDDDHSAPFTPFHLTHGRRLDLMLIGVEDKIEDPDYLVSDELNNRHVYLCKILKLGDGLEKGLCYLSQRKCLWSPNTYSRHQFKNSRRGDH